ncbi:MAG: hypothetical protein R3F43_16505 [bacterium]
MSRGTLDPRLFLRLCERLVAAGQEAEVLDVLRTSGLLDPAVPPAPPAAQSVDALHSVEVSTAAASVGGSEDASNGQWAVAGHAADAPAVDANVLIRAEHLRVTATGESRPLPATRSSRRSPGAASAASTSSATATSCARW